jgi:hypothetical protein
LKPQKFAIDNESPPRLELRWQGTDVHVHLDGTEVAVLAGWRGLKRGWSAELEDGSRLEVRTIRRGLGLIPELSVLRNGQHVPSSPSHPDKILRASSNAMLLVSVIVIVSGLRSFGSGGWLDAVLGLFYVAGALLLRNRRRLGAAVVAVPLFVRLDLLLLVAVLGQVDRSWFIDLALSLIFVSFVVRSYQAARDSRALRP